MRAAGISPALIYAYEETGLIVTQENGRLTRTSSSANSTRRCASTHDLGLGETSKLG
jgi:hypothetical protein